MRKIILIGLALCAAGVLVRSKETGEQSERKPLLSPFLAALALEAGIFLLRRHQGALLSQTTQDA
jgi:hypothetical protein